MSVTSRKSSVVSMLWSLVARSIERVRRWNGALAERPFVSVAIVVVISLLLAIAGGAAVGFPEPVVHDEHSYLLGAETFAAGRLTNPRHPMAEFFQTFHVLQEPTYASKYPPAQALALATGIVLAGKPIVGVWLSFAIMCAGIYWMLRAWVGPRWALAGAVALALRLASSYWVYQYWGGSVAALGGALVLGGARRVVDAPRARDAVLMTLGAVLLANSRPYEGLLLCVPIAIVVLWWVVGRYSSQRRRLVAVALPAAALAAIAGVAMLRYNHAVTGHATRFPYLEYRAQYGRGPDFVWQELRGVPLSADTLVRRYQEWELASADSLRTPAGFASENIDRMKLTIAFFFPIWLLAPFLALPIALRDRWSRVAAICLGVTLTGLALSSWYQPHYAAPATGLFILLYFLCLAWCRRLRIGRFDAGRNVVAFVLAGWTASQLAKLAVPIARTRGTGVTPEWAYWAGRRADVERELRSEPGLDLVIVRYGPDHDFHHEWVRNAADIDRAAVVWAHDRGAAENARLMEYFGDRKVWLLEVNDRAGGERRRSVDRRKPNE